MKDNSGFPLYKKVFRYYKDGGGFTTVYKYDITKGGWVENV